MGLDDVCETSSGGQPLGFDSLALRTSLETSYLDRIIAGRIIKLFRRHRSVLAPTQSGPFYLHRMFTRIPDRETLYSRRANLAESRGRAAEAALLFCWENALPSARYPGLTEWRNTEHPHFDVAYSPAKPRFCASHI